MEDRERRSGEHDRDRRHGRRNTSRRSATSRIVTPFFTSRVDDVQAYLGKATALGGKMLMPPIQLPTGTFAWFADPEGNAIGLWKDKE
jgi:predicted enzyme related to lactoylglutathione lyase